MTSPHTKGTPNRASPLWCRWQGENVHANWPAGRRSDRRGIVLIGSICAPACWRKGSRSPPPAPQRGRPTGRPLCGVGGRVRTRTQIGPRDGEVDPIGGVWTSPRCGFEETGQIPKGIDYSFSMDNSNCTSSSCSMFFPSIQYPVLSFTI